MIATTSAASGSDCLMRFGLSDEALTYDPISAYQKAQSALVATHMALPLVTNHRSGHRVLVGASAITVDSDAATITFDLDPSCHWSDGRPVTAADYVAGIEYSLDIEAHPMTLGITGQGNKPGVVALSTHALQIAYEGSAEALLLELGRAVFAPLPSHTGLSAAAYFDQPLPARIVAGPYQADAITEGSAVLTRNPHFCAEHLPAIDRVELYAFASEQDRMRAFVNQDVDLITFAPAPTLRALSERQPGFDMSFYPSTANGMVNLIINPTTLGLDDVNVRRALSLALDYQRFLETGLDEHSVTRSLARGFIGPEGATPNPQIGVDDVSYADLAQARALMRAAGYSEDTPLHITLTTYPIADYETTARQAASMISRAYFEAEFVPQASINAAIETIYDGTYMTFVDGYVPSLFDPAFGVSVFADDILAPILAATRQTQGQLTPELHGLEAAIIERLDDIRSLDDPAARLSAIHDAERLIKDSAIITPLYTQTRNLVVRSDFTPLPIGFPMPGGMAGQYWTSNRCEG